MDPFGAMVGKQTYSSQDIQDLKAMYDGALRYLDDMVGALDDHLAALGRRTSSDHVSHPHAIVCRAPLEANSTARSIRGQFLDFIFVSIEFFQNPKFGHTRFIK